MRLTGAVAGALLVAAAVPALAQDCEQFRRMAETARRNSGTGIRNNDEAQRQAAAQYDRAYAACRSRSGGGMGAGTGGAALPSIPHFTPPPVIDNSGRYNSMVGNARRQSSGMDMSMPGRSSAAAAAPATPAAAAAKLTPQSGGTLAEKLAKFNQALASPNSCLRDLGAAGQFLASSAETCRVDGKSLQSNVDVRAIAANDINLNEADAPGWTRVGGGVYQPNCHVKLGVASQQDSFSECLRVYLCGMEATECAIDRISASPGDSCESHVSACMAQHPVPQN